VESRRGQGISEFFAEWPELFQIACRKGTLSLPAGHIDYREDGRAPQDGIRNEGVAGILASSGQSHFGGIGHEERLLAVGNLSGDALIESYDLAAVTVFSRPYRFHQLEGRVGAVGKEDRATFRLQLENTSL
jgi:hypothetical protein